MNCEQKSGVFLNIVCNSVAENNCSNCQKQVCKTHLHRFKEINLCEDCYWERYLYTEEEKYVPNDYEYHNERTIIASTGLPSNSDNADTGFGGGFGSGDFGGGGAGGEWTEGDKQSLNNTTSENGNFLDNDSTFFYS